MSIAEPGWPDVTHHVPGDHLAWSTHSIETVRHSTGEFCA